MSLVIASPPRCFLINVTSGGSIACLFNPTQLTETVQVHWHRLPVPGLSHQVLQFQSTGNRSFQGVEFYLDRFYAREQPGQPEILGFRNFIRALTVPPEGVQGVVDTAPPRTLVIWPNVLTVEAVVTQVAFHYRQFSVTGNVLVYTAVVTFEEILDTRVTSEQLLEGR